MNKSWKKQKLSERSKIFTDGDWIETKHQSSNGIRLIQTGNIGTGFFKENNSRARYISDSTFKKLNCMEVFENDCLVSRLPDPVGRTCIIPDLNTRMITAVDCTIIRFDKKKIIPDFFNYYSQSLQYLNDVDIKTTGATRQRISRKNLGEIIIPFPPIPEQKRIVAILDKAFAAIDKAKANAQKNLQNSRELFESYLNKVFANPGQDWEEKKLGDIAKVIGGFSFKSKDFKKSGRYQVLRMGNVRPGLIRPNEKPVFFDSLDENILIRSLLKPNDVIITQTGTKKKRDYGYTAIIDKNNYLLNQRISAIRFDRNYSPKFFLYYSWTNYFKDQYFLNETGTVGQGNVGINAITGALVPFCKFSVQKLFVKKIDDLLQQTKKLETIYQQKLADLEELKKSILQKAFNGELSESQIERI